LTITDLKTKSGTTIDGQLYRDAAYDLTEDAVTIIIGKYEQEFRYATVYSARDLCSADANHRVVWHPVVMFFNFSPRELQSDSLSRLREKFEPLDIKLTTHYTPAVTHLVAKKRNTAMGLQALIDAKYIITSTFLDALHDASAAVSEEDSTSFLEGDFDKHWPNELDHLPPRSNEKADLPPSAYTPDAERSGIFEGYTYVFYEKGQYDNLLPTIVSGKGKALLYKATPGTTTVDEFVRYAKAVAGEKGLGSFEDGSEGKGVVVVRHTPSRGDHVDWYRTFFQSVSLQLDHRLIEQSEFLEAILRKEPGMLRRPLLDEEVQQHSMSLAQALPRQETTQGKGGRGGSRQATSVVADEEAPPPSVAEEAPPPSFADMAPPPRKTKARPPIKRRFVGFDDEEEDSKIDVVVKESPSSPVRATPAEPEEESQGLFVSQDPPRQTRSSRKRAASPLSEDDDEIMEIVAPTAMARKRARIERGQASPSPIREVTPKVEEALPEAKPNGKKTKSVADILDIDIKKMQEEDEARRRADLEVSSSRLAAMTEAELAAIRGLAIVEDVEAVSRKRCPPRDPNSAALTSRRSTADAQWDDRWNGRKNFKRFRRQGQPMGRRPMRNIIELVESEASDFGIGDKYWTDSSAHHGEVQSGADGAFDGGHSTQTQTQGELSAVWREFGRSLSRMPSGGQLAKPTPPPPTRPLVEQARPAPGQSIAEMVRQASKKASTHRRGGHGAAAASASQSEDDMSAEESWEDASRFRRPQVVSASVESADAAVNIAPSAGPIVVGSDSEGDVRSSRRLRGGRGAAASPQPPARTTRASRATRNSTQAQTQTQTQVETQLNTVPSQPVVTTTTTRAGTKRGLATTSWSSTTQDSLRSAAKRHKPAAPLPPVPKPVYNDDDSSDSDGNMKFVMKRRWGEGMVYRSVSSGTQSVLLAHMGSCSRDISHCVALCMTWALGTCMLCSALCMSMSCL
jgi:hypothetical protein